MRTSRRARLSVALLLAGLATAGCKGHRPEAQDTSAAVAPAPKVVTDFDLTIRRGKTSHDLEFVYRGKEPIYQPSFQVLAYDDNNAIKPHSGGMSRVWQPDVAWTVTVPDDPSVKEVALAGGGYLPLAGPAGAQPNHFQSVFLSARWAFRKK